MITLYGVTEDGTSVPVQVTADGRIVAQGLEGERGPEGPPGADSQVPGPPGAPGEYGPNDDVVFGSAQFADTVAAVVPGNTTAMWFGQSGSSTKFGNLYVAAGGGGQLYLRDQNGKILIELYGNTGEAAFAERKAGFNSNGELYFWSRNSRYKLVIGSNGLVTAEEYAGTYDEDAYGEFRKPETPDIVSED